jgi:hypothetical protein
MNEVSLTHKPAAIDNDNIITEDDIVRYDVDEADYDNFEHDHYKRTHDEAFPDDIIEEGGKKTKVEK